ncbi:MAG: hypothetical protein R3316_00540 [Rhodovibrionaceae bacterium]|nr:hypothetical protein [Rhodovibrionaceae bacterium]
MAVARSLVLLCLLGLWATSLAGPQHASAAQDGDAPQWPGIADTGWQAHAVLKVGGEEISLEIYHDDGRERQETTLDGTLQVVILRPELGRAFVVLPEQDDVIEISLDDAGVLPFSVGFDDVRTDFLGEEMLGGEKTWHYRVVGPDRLGQHFEGEVWVTPDGIPLRMEGEVTAGGDLVDFSMQLSLLSRGDQPEYLFVPPVESPSALSGGG